MDANTLIPLGCLVCYCALFVMVFGQRSRSKVNVAFLYYLVAMIAWSFGSLMMHANLAPEATLSWNRVTTTGGLTTPVVFLYFVQSFLRTKRRARWLRVAVISWLVLLGGNAAGYLISDAYVSGGQFHYHFGPLLPLMALNWYFFVGLALFDLQREYRATKDAVYRNRILYPLIGISLVALGTLTDFTPAGQYPVDIAANLINALLIAYAIVRHELLDLSLVVRRGLAYTAMTAILGLAYLVPALAIDRLLHVADPGLSRFGVVFYVLIAAAIASSIQPLHAAVKARIDRLFLRERYDALGMVQEMGRQMTATLDLNTLTTTVVDRLRSTLHIQRLGLLLREETNGEYRLCAGSGLAGEVAEVRWRPDHPIVRWLESTGRVLARNELDILPQFRGMWSRDSEMVAASGSELFVPLRVEDKVVGILVVGPRQSEESYTAEDRSLLSTLASQIAVAVENGLLYAESERRARELQALSEKLEEMVAKRTARIQELERQRSEMEKLAATGRMAARVAHEINNPLSGIKYGFLLLKDGIARDYPYYEYVGRIEAEIERIARIVRQMYELYKPDQEPVREFRVDETIRDVVGLLRLGSRGSQVDIVIDTPGDLPPVRQREDLLRQVLYNLTQNAIEASPAGGTVRIEARVLGDQLEITLADQGSGIPEDIRGRIFEPFFSTKADRQRTGLGLGLSVSRNLVEAMGGLLELGSTTGQGTIFRVCLPVQGPESGKNG